MQAVLQGNSEYTTSVFHASAEIDAGSFFKIFCRAGDLCNFVAFHKYLRQHFIVKYKVIIIGLEINIT